MRSTLLILSPLVTLVAATWPDVDPQPTTKLDTANPQISGQAKVVTGVSDANRDLESVFQSNVESGVEQQVAGLTSTSEHKGHFSLGQGHVAEQTETQVGGKTTVESVTNAQGENQEQDHVQENKKADDQSKGLSGTGSVAVEHGNSAVKTEQNTHVEATAEGQLTPKGATTLKVEGNVQKSTQAQTDTTKGDASADPKVSSQVHSVKKYTAADIAGLDYVSPFDLAGNMSLSVTDHKKADPKPEPINTIISANSWFGHFKGDYEHVLTQKDGFSQYLSALDLSRECLGPKYSKEAFARVNGPHPELRNFLYRDGLSELKDGSCAATTSGGLRIRGWRQDLTGAFFLGPVLAQDLSQNHDPAPNGYNAGRDELVRRAQLGGTDILGCVWPPATVHGVEKLLNPDAGGPGGIWNHDLGIDGVVSVITVGRPVCPPTDKKGDNNSQKTDENSTWKGQKNPNYAPTPLPDGSGDENNGGKGGKKVAARPSTGSSMPTAALTAGSLFAGFLIAVLAL